MTNPQIWTMIGAFSAVMFGGFGLMVRVLRAEIGGVRAEVGGLRNEMHAEIGGLRNEMHAEIGGLRNEMHAEIGGVRAEIGGVRAEIGGVRAEVGGLRGEMNARFDASDQKLEDKFDSLAAITAARFTDVDHRLEALETDMRLIKGHLIGQRSA